MYSEGTVFQAPNEKKIGQFKSFCARQVNGEHKMSNRGAPSEGKHPLIGIASSEGKHQMRQEHHRVAAHLALRSPNSPPPANATVSPITSCSELITWPTAKCQLVAAAQQADSVSDGDNTMQ